MTLRQLKRIVCSALVSLVSLVSVGVGAPTHSATLAWSYTQNTNRPATSFIVQRGTMTGTVCPLTDYATALPVTTLTWVDTAVTAGVTYCYVVLAADTTGRSAPSNQVSFTVYDLNVVGNLTVTVQ